MSLQNQSLIMLSDLTIDSFKPLIGSRFECRYPGIEDAIDCELREVSVLSVGRSEGQSRVPFSLLFLFKIDGVLAQQMYTINHPHFSQALELFLVPVGQADGGLLLEAVFN